MLQNTAFHDNLYQLARIIDINTDGLKLELSENIFLEKTIDDMRFLSRTMQTLFTEIQNLSHLPEYLPILHCLYSCEISYLLLLKSFAAKVIEKKLELPISAADLTAYHNIHTEIKEQIEGYVQEADKNLDAYQMVSKNELSELLNF